eukprot:TRINITY_DN11475_c0_g1_i1.p1 TRINITY_DN11475_c0_g1~~TRINITY_DN11475_c0_g1_i1.p1  ORF type:complete len:698 (-),score=53.90 TRINITY_DN11475_c0_g1_i1:218-2311(-)
MASMSIRACICPEHQPFRGQFGCHVLRSDLETADSGCSGSSKSSTVHICFLVVVVFIIIAELFWAVRVAQRTFPYLRCCRESLSNLMEMLTTRRKELVDTLVRGDIFTRRTASEEDRKVAEVYARMADERSATAMRVGFIVLPMLAGFWTITNLSFLYGHFFDDTVTVEQKRLNLHDNLVEKQWLDCAIFLLAILPTDLNPALATHKLTSTLLVSLTLVSFLKLPFLTNSMSYYSWAFTLWSYQSMLAWIVSLKRVLLISIGTSLTLLVYTNDKRTMLDEGVRYSFHVNACALTVFIAYASHSTAMREASAIVSELKASSGQAVAHAMLSSMCDAVVSLGSDQCVLGKSPQFDALLIRSRPSEGCRFIDSIDESDRSRIEQFLAMADGDVTQTRVTSTMLMDSQRQSVKVRLYHTSFLNLSSDVEHVIGVMEEGDQWRRVPAPEDVSQGFLPTAIGKVDSGVGQEAVLSNSSVDDGQSQANSSLEFKVRLEHELRILHQSDATLMQGISSDSSNFSELMCARSRQDVLPWLTSLMFGPRHCWAEHYFGEIQLSHPTSSSTLRSALPSMSRYALIANIGPEKQARQVDAIPEDPFATESTHENDFFIHLVPLKENEQSSKKGSRRRTNHQQHQMLIGSGSADKDVSFSGSKGVQWPGDCKRDGTSASMSRQSTSSLTLQSTPSKTHPSKCSELQHLAL